MRTLAIGDIHGCLRALDLLLEFVQPTAGDVVVTLGDYVDRGPDSRGVLDRLIRLQQQCRLVPLKGNHDLMMLEARTDPTAFEEWCACGGKQTLESYGNELDWRSFQNAVPPEHWRFLESTLPFHEADTHFFVHANADHDIPLQAQAEHTLYWERLNEHNAHAHDNGKVMICGHTSQRSGRPLDFGFAVCIDTWVYGAGFLTCLDIQSRHYWQANQNGKRELRVDWLDH